MAKRSRENDFRKRVGLSVDSLGRQVAKEFLGNIKDIFQERISEHTGEQSVDSFGRQVMQVMLYEIEDSLQRISDRIREQTIDGHASRVMKEVVEVVFFVSLAEQQATNCGGDRSADSGGDCASWQK